MIEYRVADKERSLELVRFIIARFRGLPRPPLAFVETL